MEYVVNSVPINTAFDRFIEKKDINEFKQHIYLELMTMKNNKLSKAYRGGYIDFLVYSMMRNQYKSSTSPWAKKNQFVNEINECADDKLEIVNEKHHEFPIGCLKKEILRLLDLRIWDKYTFLKNQYHKKLFVMYYFEKRTYQEIEKLTGVGMTSIQISVKKSLEYIKNNINYGDFID